MLASPSLTDKYSSDKNLLTHSERNIARMPITTRAASAQENVKEEVECRDVPDSQQLRVTIDSAGRRFSGSDAVPIHSCINIATQVDDNDRDDGVFGFNFTKCAKNAILQRLAYAVCGILVVVIILLLERTLKVDVIDEKQLVKDLAGQLLAQHVNGQSSAPASPTPTTNQ